MIEWQPIETAPKDGTPVWAWLFDVGIRQVRWWSAEEIAEEEGDDEPENWAAGWYEVRDWNEGWSPKFWLPVNAIPEPPE